MADRQWLLNLEALKAAKECIRLVQQDLDVKPSLADPNLLVLLREYAEVSDSPAFIDSYRRLFALAKLGDAASVEQKRVANGTVVRFGKFGAPPEFITPSRPEQAAEEMVNYNGRSYPKYRDGQEFAGVYRGSPRYA